MHRQLGSRHCSSVLPTRHRVGVRAEFEYIGRLEFITEITMIAEEGDPSIFVNMVRSCCNWRTSLFPLPIIEGTRISSAQYT